MPTRSLRLLFVLVLAVSLCTACASREEKAQKMLIQTNEKINKGNWVEIKEHLNKIISKYPETDAAATATILVEKATEGANTQAGFALRYIYTTAIDYSVSHPYAEKLDVIKLREEGLGKFKDVEIKFIRDNIQNFLITSEHVAGDRVYSIDSNGRIESWSKG